MSEKCGKAGCGAARIPGHPCSDGDCPQQWVHHIEHREIIKAFGARGQEVDWNSPIAASPASLPTRTPEELESLLSLALGALTEIKKLKAEPIGDSGFSTGPALHMRRAKEIASQVIAQIKGGQG